MAAYRSGQRRLVGRDCQRPGIGRHLRHPEAGEPQDDVDQVAAAVVDLPAAGELLVEPLQPAQAPEVLFGQPGQFRRITGRDVLEEMLKRNDEEKFELGRAFTMKALAFFPHAEKKSASVLAMKTMIQRQKAAGADTAALEQMLKDLEAQK